MKKVKLVAGLLFVLIGGGEAVYGQSPPLGPKPHQTNTNQLPLSVVINFVRTAAQTAVDAANVQIHQQHKSISVHLTSINTNTPYVTPTIQLDRPNQNYVDVLMNVTLSVSIPATSDRTISLPVDVNAFCDGWQNGKGNLKLVANVGNPYVEGGNIVEDILHIRDYINGQIKSHLVGISGAITTSLPAQCVTLGAFVPSDHSVNNSAIMWDAPPQRRIITTSGDAVVSPLLQVQFLRLKRLPARGNGGVLYSPTENFLLSTYTNFDYRQMNLTMNEGDDVALNMAPVTLKPPLLDSLVVIANIAQGPNQYPEDSAWDASQSSASFSPGVHKITITKAYSRPPDRYNPKPVTIHVPAYEMTYNVSYSKPMNRASTR